MYPYQAPRNLGLRHPKQGGWVQWLIAGLSAVSSIWGSRKQRGEQHEQSALARERAALDKALTAVRRGNLVAFQDILGQFFGQQETLFERERELAYGRFLSGQEITDGLRDQRQARNLLEYEQLRESQGGLVRRLESSRRQQGLDLRELDLRQRGQEAEISLQREGILDYAARNRENRLIEQITARGQLAVNQAASGAVFSSRSFQSQRAFLRSQQAKASAFEERKIGRELEGLELQSIFGQEASLIQQERINEIAALEQGNVESALRSAELQRLLLGQIAGRDVAVSQESWEARMRSLGVENVGEDFGAIFNALRSSSLSRDYTYESQTAANELAWQSALISFDRNILQLEQQVAQNQFSFQDQLLGLDRASADADLSARYGVLLGNQASFTSLQGYFQAAMTVLSLFSQREGS